MRLGGNKIREAFSDGTWKAYRGDQEIAPDEVDQQLKIGPHSIDVTLGDFMLVQTGPKIVDPMVKQDQRLFSDPKYFPTLLMPGECALAYVRERFDARSTLFINGRFRHFTTQIDGRSTVGRLFLLVHVTAGYGDYGFRGNYTLELVNLSQNPIRLHSGMRIAQVSFEEVEDPRVYQGAYGDDHINRPVEPILGPDRFL